MCLTIRGQFTCNINIYIVMSLNVGDQFIQMFSRTSYVVPAAIRFIGFPKGLQFSAHCALWYV